MQEMQETQVQSLGREDPLEEEMATHPSILAWEIPWTGTPTVHGVAKESGMTWRLNNTFLDERLQVWLPQLMVCVNS